MLENKWQDVSSPSLVSEQQIFENLSIDAAVIAAIRYLHSRAALHLISMTFYRQPSVPSPRAEEGGRKEGRGLLDDNQPTPHAAS